MISNNEIHKIDVVVNGEVMLLDKNVSVLDLLQILEMNNRRFVVVVNDEFIPKSMYGNTELTHNNRCDIMTPISGG